MAIYVAIWGYLCGIGHLHIVTNFHTTHSPLSPHTEIRLVQINSGGSLIHILHIEINSKIKCFLFQYCYLIVKRNALICELTTNL